jgi:MscS family membrane protein
MALVSVGALLPTAAVLAQAPEIEATAGTLPPEGTPAPTPTGLLEEVVVTRTPMPTATPDWLQREVIDLATQSGLGATRFLGLGVSDWTNLGVSLLLILAGYLLGSWLIRGVLPLLVRRTPTLFDDRLLEIAGPDLRWLVVVFALQFATARLTFVSASLKLILSDVYFVVAMVLVVRILSRSLTFTDAWYRERSTGTAQERDVAPVITLLVRVGRLLLVIVGLGVVLSHFGINVTALTAALGLGALAISLAARDTIADAIAGLIILVDRPFRVGDRIEIQGANTWGDVADIGLRTTRIRTRDNRMVIVPNSVISANQVINYSYPDPRYRIETRVSIAYGTDIERAKQVIVAAVRQVEGVLPDKPVDALYADMAASSMVFRVRWWIESYADTFHVVDRVHTAIQGALEAAGIESPYPTQNVNLKVTAETAAQISGPVARSGSRSRRHWPREESRHAALPLDVHENEK